jgi:NMT1/THI5 like
MSVSRLSRRSLLANAAAVPLAPALGRAQTLQHVDLLIDWKPAPTYAGFYIARETGAFERRGLDVRIVEGHGASVAAEMVGTSRSTGSVRRAPPPRRSAARETCRSAASPSTTGVRRRCSIRAPRTASTRRAIL